MDKENFDEFHKLMGIVGELYFDSPKYFKDCFFDMYYQIKKKIVVDDACYGDSELIGKTWGSLNYFKKLVKEDKKSHTDAMHIACGYYKVDPDKIQSIIRAFNAYRGAKKTKFKNILQ